ncbi:MAG: 4Fe-4S dicluster domain-containing protein, partial [Acidobacteria bacterium]|nr:4Fe-4S dicluster domain-containing protein [Acidobacteriota bacterium]
RGRPPAQVRQHEGRLMGRFDERDIPFSRVRLRPGTPEFASYYAMRPGNKGIDDEIRSLPGLLADHAGLSDPALFASAEACFFLTESLRDAVDGPVAARRLPHDPRRMTDYLKSLALYYGARSAGVAELRPYHVYSHVGRDLRRYGDPIPFEPGWALAFTVEMDERMVRSAPFPPTVMESARQYVEAARIAVPLGAAIRAMGYPARAHIDGSYRVVAPLVARDAGLGEIGRMGLLMTPRLGPRVRLGVITTSLELVPDGPARDATVVDFCSRCRKCADNCPAQAIPDGDGVEAEGGRRWQVNGDACFRYWSAIGTDCARCLAVCPYAHSDHPFHNAVRWGVRRSALFRRAAVRLDDVCYGRRPAPLPGPPWTRTVSRLR